MPEWIVDRGEAISFLVVAAALVLSIRPLSRSLHLPARVVEDQLWWGGLLFIVVGRLAAVADASPDLLLDVPVLLRFTHGLAPIPGAAVALAWTLWRRRGRTERGAMLAAAVAALTLAAATYGLACPVREGCVGTTAPSPLGFPMHGLVEPRLATPVIEAALLLVALAVAVRLLGRMLVEALGWGLLATLAGVRLALLPLSATGADALIGGVLGLVVVAGAGLAWRGARERDASRGQPTTAP